MDEHGAHDLHTLAQRPLSRRLFLAGAGATGIAVATGWRTSAAASPLPDELFTLGVASGDPLPDGVILWTRLAPQPVSGGGMPNRAVPVHWQVGTDDSFRHIVRQDTQVARPALAHSVHVDVRGLEPGREYFYRFKAGQALSAVGRTKTAPAHGAALSRFRLAVANCQDMQNGYWPAYVGLADEDLDLVLHLGDYIYEYDPRAAAPADRRHHTPETPGLDQLRTLADYRNRHAQYKRDPALQTAHAAAPWLATWDDHETENNYANLIDEIDDTGARRQTPAEFAAQRAAAYQAYYEHMPIRAHFTAGSPDLQIYRRYGFGDLVEFNVLDTRQYRTDQQCGAPDDLGPAACGALDPNGTMTGATQEQWLFDGLATAQSRWNVLAQQTILAQTRFVNPFGEVPAQLANLDQWDGYIAARRRLLSFLAQAQPSNPVVLTGDIHSSWVSDIKADFDNPGSATIASEFVSPSISSNFPPEFIPLVIASNQAFNPWVKHFDGVFHGYLRCDVTPERWRTDIRVVPTIVTPVAPVTTLKSFVVEDGQPGPVPS
jgi:alkaline phosphatase D